MDWAEIWETLPDVPQKYAILPNEVHVWRTRVSWLSRCVSVLTDIISREEQQKSQRFHFQADRERRIIRSRACKGCIWPTA
jgi:hypothetical protein